MIRAIARNSNWRRRSREEWQAVLALFAGSGLRHDARIIPSRFDAPYRKSGKNDGNDGGEIATRMLRVGYGTEQVMRVLSVSGNPIIPTCISALSESQ